MINWEAWFLDMENKHRVLISVATYILRESGGLAWPLLYGIILWVSWGILSQSLQMIFVFAGIILTAIAIIYPKTWRLWSDNKKEDIANIDVSYYKIMDYFSQLDLWGKSREKGFENELLNLNKKIIEALKRLQKHETLLP